MKTASLKILSLLLTLLLITACQSETKTADPKPNATKPAETMGPAPTKTAADFTFDGKSFQGVAPGMAIETLKKKFVAGEIKGPEGIYQVYFFKDGNGRTLGYFFHDPTAYENVGDLVIISPDVKTPAGIHVGMSYGDFQKLGLDYEAHGSETESRTYLTMGQLNLRLDYPSNKYDLDKASIPNSNLIIEMIVRRN